MAPALGLLRPPDPGLSLVVVLGRRRFLVVLAVVVLVEVAALRDVLWVAAVFVVVDLGFFLAVSGAPHVIRRRDRSTTALFVAFVLVGGEQ